MKKLILCLLFLAGCGPSTTVQLIPGPTGPQGETGATGATGANGHSLVSQTVAAGEIECATSGNRLDIYLDMDDSLSVSEGDQFQSALIACNGANGLNGADGLAGATGATGATGDTGATGAQGVPGAAGPQGLAGPAGSVGPQGAQGVAGPVGPAGPQGPQGTTGAQGPAGSGATLQAYTLSSSCQSIGSSFYAKKSGDTALIYTADSNPSDSSGNCDTQVATLYSVHTANGQGSMWLSATRLAFADSDTTSGVVVRVLNFN